MCGKTKCRTVEHQKREAENAKEVISKEPMVSLSPVPDASGVFRWKKDLYEAAEIAGQRNDGLIEKWLKWQKLKQP